MRRVRESRHVTVGDLHDETKIPLGLIEAFEENALFDHPQFNRVYLRSFVRTYANVIGIETDVALAALEEALSNRYAGSLVAEYFGEMPPERTVERAEAADADTTEGDEAIAHVGERGRPEGRLADTRAEEDESLRPDVDDAARKGEATPRPVAEPEEDVEEWTMQSPPRPKRTSPFESRSRTGRPASARAGAQRRTRGPDRRWIAAVVAVVAVAAVVWVVVSVNGGDETPGTETEAIVDTAAAADVATSEPDVPTTERRPMPTLGDTMHVYVVAARDKLDPIRVTVDDDLRRPYWLEHGDSMAFRPTNRIVVEELLDDLRLSIEGVDYPTDRRDDRGRIVITRDSVQTHFASVSGQ